MIAFQRVAHTFGGVRALAGIDLEVAEHEFVAVIGRSGCGKSTLLRIAAGLLTPSRGRVLVAGEEVTAPCRDVSLMFQRPALLPWRSVLANVLLPAEVLGLGEQRSRAHELLELVGLGGFEERLPHELSGGMQQRVSLCRSLLQDPGVMLMDEPFSALDAITRTELSEELQRIQREQPRTVLFVTHSVDEAVLLADRVVVLSPRPGRVHEITDVPLARPRALGRAELDEVSRAVRASLGEVTA
ncbi:NitT/TauT family transport system ATP-binding protein [Lentzea xinjiangensis]|uniref:NitT/TauT family transport system ATP-binding protein n=1 Tax=Lentzea xinjiangensis TaxID=402600 RepID=A0A1H9JNG3_9PSEU|nr:ABC transporter ATP-binding protein [Lentzea xinjiangensis]SEQ88165.1 NitT/TauT family transport system ATP-binding protein [Lentzea xinjiangensis]